jgi:hypothetical protein
MSQLFQTRFYLVSVLKYWLHLTLSTYQKYIYIYIYRTPNVLVFQTLLFHPYLNGKEVIATTRLCTFIVPGNGSKHQSHVV